MIICGRYAGVAKKSEEKFLFGPYEIVPEGFSGFEAKGVLAEVVEFLHGAFFDLGRRLPGEITGFEFLSLVAESGAEVEEAIAEEVDSSVLFDLGQQSVFSANLLGVGDEMGETDLPVYSDAVIGSITVTDQRSVEVLSKDAFCYLGRPMSVDMKEGEAWIACEPDVMAHAVITPVKRLWGQALDIWICVV